jgi:tRNA U34 5-methylaminomethyl-2-thiouridine-forming methyltransferase MnmC
VWQQLNYKVDVDDALNSSFKKMHECVWESWQRITNNFEIYKSAIDFRDAKPFPGVDLVYFDAFAPDKQPDLWNAEVFAKIFASMNSGGVLVTYCAKGVVRRMLQEVGFMVERLPGPPPKKEMLRARKP